MAFFKKTQPAPPVTSDVRLDHAYQYLTAAHDAAWEASELAKSEADGHLQLAQMLAQQATEATARKTAAEGIVALVGNQV